MLKSQYSNYYYEAGVDEAGRGSLQYYDFGIRGDVSTTFLQESFARVFSWQPWIPNTLRFVSF